MFNLFMKSNKKRAKRRGFTLIELVIVIVILGVLAGVAALSFTNVTQSSRDGVAKANLRAIKSAIQLYQVEHGGKFPTIASADTDVSTLDGTASNPDLIKYLEKDLLKKPSDTYKYLISPGTGDYAGGVELTVKDGARVIMGDDGATPYKIGVK